MLNRIREATPEEIETIRENSEITEGSVVLAFDTPKGVALAVIRSVVELDPIHFPAELEPRWKGIFVRDLETVLTTKGVRSYFFSVWANEDMKSWREIVEKWGAQCISLESEFRYRKDL